MYGNNCFPIQGIYKCQTKSWMGLFSTLESTLQVIKQYEMISLLRQCNSFLISRNSILLVSFRYRSTASQNFMTSLGRLVTTNWYPCYVSGSLGLSVNWRVKDCPLFKFEKENATVCCEKDLALPIGPDWLKILAHIRKFCSLTSLYTCIYS